MAKRFAGFTPEQMGKIIPEMQGMQADEQKKFLAANPAAAARVGKMFETAQKRIGMAEGGMAVSLEDRLNAQRAGFMGAGQQAMIARPQPARPDATAVQNSSEYKALQDYVQSTAPNSLDRNKIKELQAVFENTDVYKQYDSEVKKYQNTITPRNMYQPNPQQPLVEAMPPAQMPMVEPAPVPVQPQPPQSGKVPPHSHTIGMDRGGMIYAADGVDVQKDDEATTDPVDETGTALKTAGETAGKLVETAVKSPDELVTETEVAKTTDEQKAAGEIEEGTGQLEGEAPKADVTVADTTTPVAEPTKIEAETVDATTIAPDVQDTLDKVAAATGKVGEDALAEAITMSPDELAQLGLTVEQIQQAQRVQAPDAREVEDGELISGSAVDMARVKKVVNFEAATGAPSTDATVQGQLTQLMEDFEGDATPAWAAGAMRAAAARMAARGLSGSSMAGQAMIQAAMESALPIAQQDAKTAATFELQNLSNKQQSAMFAAQQRANFLGLEFNQEFQTRVANAAKISDIANMNFTAEQQVALENARMAQSVDITNLNAKNAKILADAAAMSQLDMANLNNRQQAQVQNANAFLQMEKANLSNEQATNIFKAQSMVNALLSDQAADNAAKQFNASSENQVNQFFADLGARVSLANAEQSNLMNRFNAGEANALAQFNTQIAEQRNQFNAANALVIAQANAQWAQTITTTDNAAQNEANRLDAQRQNEFTALGYNSAIQQYRDMMSYAWKTGDNDAQRATSLAIAQIQADVTRYAADKASQDAANAASSNKSSAMWTALGTFAGSLDWGSIL